MVSSGTRKSRTSINYQVIDKYGNIYKSRSKYSKFAAFLNILEQGLSFGTKNMKWVQNSTYKESWAGRGYSIFQIEKTRTISQ